MNYSTKDLAIIIPTKDRPEQVKRHLQSLVDQSCELGRVIIVASGMDIEEIVDGFAGQLPVEYYKSEPGQIKQRNYGISLLDDRTKLVATMDDDIVYDKNSISNMIELWNKLPESTGGVGFNIITESYGKLSSNRTLLYGRKINEKGKVLRSGVATSLSDVQVDTKTEWLNGGATVWLQKVLLNKVNKEIKSKWAVYEDVIFSYPIGRKMDLFISSSSKVYIECISIEAGTMRNAYIVSLSIVLWRYYFVLQNNELSRLHYFVSVLYNILLGFSIGVILLKRYHVYRAVGMLIGILKIVSMRNHKEEIINLLENI